jgi:hypothetical protein
MRFTLLDVPACCAAGPFSSRMLLSLSVKVTALPVCVRDQPSGTLTLKPAPGGA